MLFTVRRLLAVKDVKHAIVLRRDVETRRRPRILPYVLILPGIGAVAATFTEGSWRDSLRTGIVFTVGLAGGIGLLAAAGGGLLPGVRRAPGGGDPGPRAPQL